MNTLITKTAGLFPVTVDNSYYITFDGKRCYCKVPVLYYSASRLIMEVYYEDGDRENYLLVSGDGINFSGMKRKSIDDGRARFRLLTHCEWVLFSGFWMCGGREGEWYIKGRRT